MSNQHWRPSGGLKAAGYDRDRSGGLKAAGYDLKPAGYYRARGSGFSENVCVKTWPSTVSFAV